MDRRIINVKLCAAQVSAMANVFYINTEYDNKVTLNKTIESSIDEFGLIKWREFFEKVVGLDTALIQNTESFEEKYGITLDQYENYIPEEIIDKYYSQISYYTDFVSGPGAKAYDFVETLKIIPVNKEGCGSSNGIELLKSTANGPSKEVFIDTEESASWLKSECLKKGIKIEFNFV